MEVIKLIVSIVSPIVGCTAEPIKQEIKQLMTKRLRWQDSMKGVTRKGEAINDDFKVWLETTVDNDIEEACEFADEGEEEVKKRCFVGLCPNLKAHYKLSKQAAKKALDIAKLYEARKSFDPVSCPVPLREIGSSFANVCSTLHSRESKLEEIMDALKRPDMKMIGVLGLAGVGKTTLAKEVHDQAVKDKLFDVGVLGHVSATPQIKEIRNLH